MRHTHASTWWSLLYYTRAPALNQPYVIDAVGIYLAYAVCARIERRVMHAQQWIIILMNDEKVINNNDGGHQQWATWVGHM